MDASTTPERQNRARRIKRRRKCTLVVIIVSLQILLWDSLVTLGISLYLVCGYPKVDRSPYLNPEAKDSITKEENNTSKPPYEETQNQKQEEQEEGWTPCSPAGTGTPGFPVIIGSLKASSYTSFPVYVRAAAAKLSSMPDVIRSDKAASDNSEQTNYYAAPGTNPRNTLIAETLRGIDEGELRDLEGAFGRRKKELSVVWGLMAYSAGVVEAMVVVDRWEWLREQKEVVGECWVEGVFEYGVSPRNLCLVGVRK